MSKKKENPDRREYTIMIVPHQGKLVRSFSIHIKAVKYGIAALCGLLLFFAGSYINHGYQLKVAQSDRAELEQYRQKSGAQQAKLDQLAKETAELQGELERLNQLEADLLGLVRSEQGGPVSRSGVDRPAAVYQGQGGPQVKPTADQIAGLVQQLKAAAKDREQGLKDLQNEFAAVQARKAATPSIWPAEGDVTSRYGWRQAPIGWGRDWHPGIDIANNYGTPIAATADGQVVESGWNGGYGKMVKIDHGNGIVTIYGHNSENLVSAGAAVKKGDIIAYMGSTGYSTGPHVHYEVQINGNTVNPASFL